MDAHDIEQAEELAREWVLEGHWDQPGREAFVSFTAIRGPAAVPDWRERSAHRRAVFVEE